MVKNTMMTLLALIMLVNALSYGIIIPLLYPYAAHFGIDPFSLSLLFMSYSLFQFLATPVIGRLSDQYGRKPLLLISLFGTAVSLALFASAQSVEMLFIARILDGITGGNMSVAQAMIADTTKGPDRAKGMGVLAATFGFGFLIGPALGGMLSYFGLSAPFWFAALLALIGTILGVFLLPETLKNQVTRHNQKEPLFNFHKLLPALASPLVGVIFMISFLSSFSQNAFIIGFQTFSVDQLKLNATQIGLIFSAFGLINIVMQMSGIRILLKTIQSQKTILQGSLLLSASVMALLYFQETFLTFSVVSLLYGVTFAPVFVLTSGLISERSKAEDQGTALGINQSLMSLGQMIGPLCAGLLAARSLSAIFLLASGIYFVSWLVSLRVATKGAVDF